MDPGEVNAFVYLQNEVQIFWRQQKTRQPNEGACIASATWPECSSGEPDAEVSSAATSSAQERATATHAST